MNRSSRSIPVLLGTAALTLAAGCSHCPAPAPCPCAQQPSPMLVAPPPALTPVPVAAPAPPPAAPAPTNIIVIKEAGLQTPECVLWDADQDVYFVSNINGDPTAADKNGFISKIGPDGKIIELKWVDSGKKGAELNAPKGMAIVGNLLFVADLDTVRKFDRKTGKPKGTIAIKDAVFLNALTVSPDGKVIYVSDSAVKIKDGAFSGTGGDAIYELDLKKHSVKPLIKDRTLNWPNGILADASGIWSVSLGKNELIHINYKGELGSVSKLPRGSLDGIVRLGDGSLLISSWEAAAIYRGVPGGEFTEVISGVASPAAIGLDTKRNALLIPIFTGSAVEIHPLPMLPLLDAPAPTAAPAKKPTNWAPGSVDVPAPPVPPSAPPARAPAATPMPIPASAPGPAPRPAPPPAPTPAPAPAPAVSDPPTLTLAPRFQVGLGPA